ncbi:heterokaryon incompatibility 6 OR allele, partial [Fusarium mundagurra]
MRPEPYHIVPIEGSYYDEHGTLMFINYLKQRGIDMYRYKVIASRDDYAYFSRDTLEDLRQNYRERMNEAAERGRKAAEEAGRQRDVQDVKLRLLAEPAPVVAKVPDELKAIKDVLPDTIKPKAVDFDLLELLLPGYRSKDSRSFYPPTEAPVYEPLPGPGWFRLLVIEPWCADKDRLKCHLRAVRIDDASGKYSALSYCWAQPVCGAVQGLVCNGFDKDAGENLRLAMQNIRYSTLPRIVWVDALCINQDDLAERSQQVQMMGDIYKQAVETIIWLGDVFPRGPSLPEFDSICQVVKAWNESLRPSYEARNAKGKLCHYEPGIAKDRSVAINVAFDASLVARVFGCPWFERRWVIQEVALASSAVVKVPGATMQWKWVGLAAGIIRTNHNWLINSYRMPNLYNAYLISRLSTHGPLPPLDLSLLSLLRLTEGFKTAEKLDVVFALLGLLDRYRKSSSSKSSSVTIRTDYKLSESKLGKLVAESHMAQSRRPLSFLSDAVGVAEKPTWSPRWSHKKISMLDPWYLNDDAEAFSPAKGLSFKRIQSADSVYLKVEGVQLSQVAWQSDRFEPYGDFNSIIADLIQILARCHKGYDIWNASIIPAVARTLCGERDRYGGRAKDLDHIATEFSNFIKAWLLCCPNYFPQLVKKMKSERIFSRRCQMAWLDTTEPVCLGRRLFYTTSGHIGLGPGNMAHDDVICILGGAVMPIVVRPLGDHFGIIGDCYVNGVMDGEAVIAMTQGRALCGPIP